MTELKKNIKLTSKDFVIYQLTSYLGSFTKNLGMLLMAGLFVFMVYFYMTTHTHYWLMVFSALPTAAYIASIVYFIPKSAVEEFEHSSYKDFEPLFILTKETLSVERKSGSTSVLKLTDLLTAWENGKYFYFFITKNNTLTIPKRQLSAEEKKFVHDVISKMPRALRRNPFKIKPMQLLGTILSFLFITFVISMIILSFTSGNK